MRSFLSFTLILQLSCSAFAQQPTPTPAAIPGAEPQKSEAQQPAGQSDDDVVRITTNLVQVDAVVTDNKGKLVTDLRLDEVEILEDKRPQQITNFSFVNLEAFEKSTIISARPADATLAPPPLVKLRPEQVRRTIALVIDDLALSFASIYDLRKALKKVLDEEVQAGDMIAIIRTINGIGALQQFTSDKRLLYAAVDKLRWSPIQLTDKALADLSQPGALASRQFPGDTGEGIRSDSGQRGAEGINRAAEEFGRFREGVATAGTIGTLIYTVNGLRDLPGRKSIIFFSDGLPVRDYARLLQLRRFIELANRSAVVVYTIDARGLAILGSAPRTARGLTSAVSDVERPVDKVIHSNFFHFADQDGLNLLAEETGGLFFRNSNDLSSGIKRSIADQKGYYLIGYRPDPSTFRAGRAKFYKLSLKVNRPGKFNVRMRSGFSAVIDAEKKPGGQSVKEQLLRALTSPFGANAVHVRLTSLFANDAKLGSFMRSFFHVKASDLTFTEAPDGWHEAAFVIAAVTLGDSGAVVDQINRTHTIRLRGKTYERVLQTGFTYNLTVPIKQPGAYQLRTVLRDSSSARLGSASQFIEVPDIKKNRLAVSGILVRGLVPQPSQPGGSVISEERNSDDQLDDVEPQSSAAVREFRRGQVLEYALEIYNAQRDKRSVKSNLKTQVRLFRNGEQVYTGQELPFDSTSQPDPKRLKTGGVIRIGAELVPGEYVLQVVITDLLAKEKRRVVAQSIDFDIVE